MLKLVKDLSCYSATVLQLKIWLIVYTKLIYIYIYIYIYLNIPFSFIS